MMLFGNRRTRTPPQTTRTVHNNNNPTTANKEEEETNRFQYVSSEMTPPTAKKNHRQHLDEEATARRRSSPASTTAAATNAERLWELQRELAKELIFSENDTAAKTGRKRGTPRERRLGETTQKKKEGVEEKNYSKIPRGKHYEKDEGSSSSSSSSPANFHHEERIFDSNNKTINSDDVEHEGEEDVFERGSAARQTEVNNREHQRRRRRSVIVDRYEDEKQERTSSRWSDDEESEVLTELCRSPSAFRDGSEDDEECCSTSSLDEEENLDAKLPQVNPELEMKLRRYELKHVDLELKLSASEEKVSEAALVLEEAEKTRDMYRKQCNRAWEEVKELERAIEEERKSVAEKLSDQMLKQKQDKAMKRAEKFRLKGNKSYAAGDLSSAEGYYTEAILLLESSGMALIDKNHLTLRTNRAAALMALGRDSDALQECLNVLNVDEENIKALSQAATCALSLSNLNSARKYIARIVLSSTASVDDLQSAHEQQEMLLRACIERDKSSGNDAYKRADYAEALRLYTIALKDASDLSDVTDEIQKIKGGLHSNRAATHMMLGHPLKAAEDCCVALKIHPGNVKIQLRYARCLLLLGDFEAAFQEASDVLTRENIDTVIKNEANEIHEDIKGSEKIVNEVGQVLKRYEEERDVTDENEGKRVSKEALEKLNKVTQIAPKIPMLITLKAEAMRFAGRYDEARLLLESNEPSDDPRRRALEARICFDLGYLSACIEAALPVTTGASSSSLSSLDACIPDRKKLILLVEQAVNAQSSRERGKVLFKEGQYEEAMGVYREALESCAAVSPVLQAIFLSNICACEQALERYVDALSSASVAISLAPTFAKARSRLATLYSELDMHKEAIEAYDSLLELPLDNEERNVANWNRREVEKKRALQPNWYKLLGLKDFSSATTTSEVKKAYKKLALVHHPDKNSAPISTKLFKLVSEASRVLCDDTEREKWWREQRRKTTTASHSSFRRTPGSASSSKSSSSNSSSSRWHSYEI